MFGICAPTVKMIEQYESTNSISSKTAKVYLPFGAVHGSLGDNESVKNYDWANQDNDGDDDNECVNDDNECEWSWWQ